MGWFPEQTGGLNRVYYNLMKHLPAVGIQPHGVVAGRSTAIGEAYHVDTFAPIESPLPRRLLGARRLMRDLNVRQYQVVGSHFALYTLPALDLLKDVPLVVHFHGPWAAEGQAEGASSFVYNVKDWVENRVYSRAQRFITLSEAFRQVLTERHRVPEEQVSIVRGGVDIGRFAVCSSRREARERLQLPPDRPIVLAVRRLAPRMGLQDLVAAAECIRQRVPEVLILIAGKGPLAGDLQTLIEDSNLSRHVRLVGFVADEDLPLAYRAADLSVVPTVALEGFGLIAAESLAAGTPVLVTPVGGLPEVVQELSQDLVLPTTGPAALAERISAALLGDIQLPDAEACQRFAAQYDWPVIAAQVARVYREVQ